MWWLCSCRVPQFSPVEEVGRGSTHSGQDLVLCVCQDNPTLSTDPEMVSASTFQESLSVRWLQRHPYKRSPTGWIWLRMQTVLVFKCSQESQHKCAQPSKPRQKGCFSSVFVMKKNNCDCGAAGFSPEQHHAAVSFKVVYFLIHWKKENGSTSLQPDAYHHEDK